MRGLDRAGEIKLGSGALDVGVYATERDGGVRVRVGGGVDYVHRLSTWASTFARAELGYTAGVGVDWLAMAGLRMRF